MKQTKYQMIMDDIRDKIFSGEYELGMLIPAESELMTIYGVSRHTVREATNRLVTEGFLKKRKGAGTFVEATSFSSASLENVRPLKTIGVITTYISDYIFPSIIRGIEQELSKQGYALILSSTNNDYQQEKECLDKMIESDVAGMIVEPTKSNQYNPNLAYYVNLREQKIPMVMINAVYEEINAPYICVDDVKVGFLATEALIKNHHKNLLLVTKIDDLQGKYRMRGFIKACEQYNIPVSSENIITYTTETRMQVIQQIAKHLKTNPNITAAFCYNDQIALMLYTELLKEGYKIPEDLSIVSDDDSLLSRIGILPLTTVKHPQEQMGIDAAKWIIQAIETGENGKNILYSPTLIERSSIRDISQD